VRVESGVQPGRGSSSLRCGIPAAEPARSSGDAGLFEDQEPVGSVRRLLCQAPRYSSTENVRVIPVIVPEFEFRDGQRQILAADLAISPHNAAVKVCIIAVGSLAGRLEAG
jgi:hypothetical protein